MFEFFNDIGTYESRMVGREDTDWGFISTAGVSDGRQPYETAVEHKGYNHGRMVIVEAYDTKELATEGHKRWVTTMSTDPLPTKLKDCLNAGVAQLGATLFGDDWADGEQTDDDGDN